MGCKGLHCDGCRHGSPAGPAAAVLALLVIVAVAARAVAPKLVHAVEIAAWIVAGLTGAVIVVMATVVTVRFSRRLRARRALRQVAPGRNQRVITGTVLGARRAIGSPQRPAWLYGSGCCEQWTPEDGCSWHTGRPAMPLQVRKGWPDRRGQR
jgi:hypothetical protein